MHHSEEIPFGLMPRRQSSRTVGCWSWRH